jgi:hypothetical protein
MSRNAFLTEGFAQALIFSSPAGTYLDALHEQRRAGDKPSVTEAIAAAGWDASTMRHRRAEDFEFRDAEHWARTGERLDPRGEALDIDLPLEETPATGPLTEAHALPGPIPASRDGLINYHLPSGNTKLNFAIRMVKLVAPQCRVCTEGPHAADWFRTCPHDPYFHAQEVPEVVEEREPQPDGTYLVTDRKTVVRVRRMPNLRQVPHSPRHLGYALRNKLLKGFALPEQLGILPFCQFGDCWSQDLPERWRGVVHGDYCSEAHAKVMAAQHESVSLEIGEDPGPRAKRADQLARVAFR